MANENNTNRQNNHQPSMRELANERMRQMREERLNAARQALPQNVQLLRQAKDVHQDRQDPLLQDRFNPKEVRQEGLRQVRRQDRQHLPKQEDLLPVVLLREVHRRRRDVLLQLRTVLQAQVRTRREDLLQAAAQKDLPRLHQREDRLVPCPRRNSLPLSGFASDFIPQSLS